METKICSKCGIQKSIDEFYKNKIFKDGFSYQCKQCTSEYHQINKEKRNKQHKQWKKNNPDKVKNYYAKSRLNLIKISRNYLDLI